MLSPFDIKWGLVIFHSISLLSHIDKSINSPIEYILFLTLGILFKLPIILLSIRNLSISHLFQNSMYVFSKQIVPNSITSQNYMTLLDLWIMKLVVNAWVWFTEFHFLLWVSMNEVWTHLVRVVEKVLLLGS